MTAIFTHELSKLYTPAKGPEVHALRGINLTILSGEIYALLGRNGAGKTTLISILTTILLPTQGNAQVAGYDVVDAPGEIRRRIGVTFQETVLDQQLTGRQTLRFHGQLYGMSAREINASIDALAGLVELTDALDRKVNAYSGGMKRRLELIRGLLTRPRILFLDEPTQGLDPQNRLGIWDYLATLRKEFNLTILLTTHYMEEAEALADRVGIIDQGRLVLEGEPKTLRARLGQDVIVVHGAGNGERLLAMLAEAPWAGRVTRHQASGDNGIGLTDVPAYATVNTPNNIVQVGVDNGAARLAELVTLAANADFQIHELTVNQPTLADVFLAATGSTLQSRSAHVDSG